MTPSRPPAVRPSRRRPLPAASLAALLPLTASLTVPLTVPLTSCGTLVGTVTGAVTGIVDAPRAIYRIDPKSVDEQPELWAPILVVFVPVGIVLGPLMGFAKGVSIDVQAGIQGKYEYGEAFGTYGVHSVWRPYTFSERVR